MSTNDLEVDKLAKKERVDIPVIEGDEYDVEIISVGKKGDGIAKVDNFVIVVPETKTGDKVRVKVNAIRGTVAFGTVVEDGE